MPFAKICEICIL